MRVQFALMSAITIREPWTSTPAAMWNAAEDGSPGTCDVVEVELVVLVTTIDAVAVAARCGTPARGEQALGVVAARPGLDHGRRARRPAGRPAARTT